MDVMSKPTVERLGIDLAAQHWRRSGEGTGAIEIALVDGPPPDGGAAIGVADDSHAVEWVLMRVSGDADGRVLVYDRNEWECFLDGVRNGEFDATVG
jgi:hypothetical protein